MLCQAVKRIDSFPDVNFVDITSEEMFNYLEDCNRTSSSRDHHESFLNKFYAMVTDDFSALAIVPGGESHESQSISTYKSEKY